LLHVCSDSLRMSATLCSRYLTYVQGARLHHKIFAREERPAMI
jgi:hypothetical protein